MKLHFKRVFRTNLLICHTIDCPKISARRTEDKQTGNKKSRKNNPCQQNSQSIFCQKTLMVSSRSSERSPESHRFDVFILHGLNFVLFVRSVSALSQESGVGIILFVARVFGRRSHLVGLVFWVVKRSDVLRIHISPVYFEPRDPRTSCQDVPLEL